MSKNLAGRIFRINIGETQEREYVFLVEKARQEWEWSKRLVEEAIDTDLIDRAIFYQLAAERRYVHLLKKAAEEKIRADEDIVIYFALAARNNVKGGLKGG
ncbi:MAG: DUF2508 family protein [Bacillota bacterium]|nr:DUF2508 family protein [Clostridia bacterium]